MKDAVLLELAARWERDSAAPESQDGSPAAVVSNAEAHGRRQGLRECADGLRMLVQLLGGKDAPEPILIGKRAGSSAPTARRSHGIDDA